MIVKSVHHISTKKGDKGMSRNYSNEAFLKDDILFETLGTMDELSANLGLTYHFTNYEMIKVFQRKIQDINAIIATNENVTKEQYDKLKPITSEDINALEEEAQRLLDLKPLEPRFILPGSEATKENAYFDIARTVCRRAERLIVHYEQASKRHDLDHVKAYINRLSDLLFILARNHGL